MTVKVKNKLEPEQPYINAMKRSEIVKALKMGEFTGKELPDEVKAWYEKKGKYTDFGPWEEKEISGPKMEEVLKRIELPPYYSKKSPSEIVKALRKIFKDFKEGKTSEDNTSKDYNYWYYLPSDLWHFYKKYPERVKVREKEYFFFGWLLIKTAEFKKKKCKKSIKHNWRIACDLMTKVTGKKKYLHNYLNKNKRKNIYKIGIRYIKIVKEAYKAKAKVDIFSEYLKKVAEAYNINSRSAIRARMRCGYDWSLTKRIHSYLMEEKKAKTRDIERKFNKRREDTYSCLLFLERFREIFCHMTKTNKEVYYIGDGKSLEEALPPDVSLFVVPEKFNKALKELWADTILIK